MLDAALDAAPAPLDPVVRARALYTRAVADLMRGRIMDCFFGFQRALDAAIAAGSRADESLSLTKIAVMAELGDYPNEARESFERARAITLELGDPALRADWMFSNCGAFLWRGRAADAVEYAEAAVEGFRAAGDRRGQSLACAALALARLSLARLDEAEAAASQSLALLEVTEDRRTEGYVLGVLGRVAQARGHFEDARQKLAAALSIHRAVGDRWSGGVLHGFLGDVAFEQGELDEARRAYGEALELLRGTGEKHYSTILRAALGAVEVRAGRREVAASHFEAALSRLENVRVLTTKVAVELHCAHADLSRAAEKIALARAAPEGSLSPALCGEDVRFAIRLLERELGRASGEEGVVLPESSVPELGKPPTLVVGPEARWFRLRDREPVNLLKARAVRLILHRLIERRVEAPGRALTLEELFEAGWPGERIQRKAAANRVYVTLTKLRQLGLGALLQSRDDGFLLDPALVVVKALDVGPRS